MRCDKGFQGEIRKDVEEEFEWNVVDGCHDQVVQRYELDVMIRVGDFCTRNASNFWR